MGKTSMVGKIKQPKVFIPLLIGLALIVIGIILIFTGAGIPASIMLIGMGIPICLAAVA